MDVEMANIYIIITKVFTNYKSFKFESPPPKKQQQQQQKTQQKTSKNTQPNNPKNSHIRGDYLDRLAFEWMCCKFAHFHASFSLKIQWS